MSPLTHHAAQHMFITYYIYDSLSLCGGLFMGNLRTQNQPADRRLHKLSPLDGMSC